MNSWFLPKWSPAPCAVLHEDAVPKLAKKVGKGSVRVDARRRAKVCF